jgi:hypothetical protein
VFHPSAGSFPTSFLGPPLATAADEDVVLLTVVVVVVLVEEDVTTPVELEEDRVVVVEATVVVTAVEVDGMHYEQLFQLIIGYNIGAALFLYLGVIIIQITASIARDTSSSAGPANTAFNISISIRVYM